MSTSPPESIDLAHTPDFRIGRLAVRASVRQLVRDDGAEEVLEPRVMQVLVALARAEGGILSRDDLTRCCWEDRIVGEDAINRVISRLRRSAEGIGEGTFRIETITKVGYRLIRSETAKAPADTKKPAVPRRALLAGGAVIAAGAALGGAGLLLRRHRQPAPSAQVDQLMIAGMTSMGQSTTDSLQQARGLFDRVTELAPDYARGWAALAALYSIIYHYFPSAEAEAAHARTLEASARALAIDPTDGLARAARVNLLPFNNWFDFERGMTAVLNDDPEEALPLQWMGRHKATTGRMAEAADLMTRAVNIAEASAVSLFDLMMWQWGAGRLDDADRSIDRGLQLFPRNFPVWFGAFYIRMFTGRIDIAIAMAENVDGRPAQIVNDEVDSVLAVARALKSRDPAEIETQSRIWMDKAHQAAGYAENAMQFLAAFGKIDEAFAVVEAYLLDRGWKVPSVRFPHGQNVFTRLADRRAHHIFLPSMRSLWTDPRFPKLLDAIGLTRYWQVMGIQPDYRKG